jgi:hypothetical protein
MKRPSLKPIWNINATFSFESSPSSDTFHAVRATQHVITNLQVMKVFPSRIVYEKSLACKYVWFVNLTEFSIRTEAQPLLHFLEFHLKYELHFKHYMTLWIIPGNDWDFRSGSCRCQLSSGSVSMVLPSLLKCCNVSLPSRSLTHFPSVSLSVTRRH